MIVVDTSALLAILLDEPDKLAFQDALARQTSLAMSAVNVHEASIVMRARSGAAAVERLLAFLRSSDIAILPFDEAQVHAARVAFERFGKGIDPKARLNLCDCAAYALARTLEVPLLFKGNDFPHTDIVGAL